MLFIFMFYCNIVLYYANPWNLQSSKAELLPFSNNGQKPEQLILRGMLLLLRERQIICHWSEKKTVAAVHSRPFHGSLLPKLFIH